MSAPKLKSSIKIAQRTTPCYCSACDAPNAISVHLVNPKCGGPLSFAVCDDHADALGQRLTNVVRRRRLHSSSRPEGRASSEETT